MTNADLRISSIQLSMHQLYHFLSCNKLVITFYICVHLSDLFIVVEKYHGRSGIYVEYKATTPRTFRLFQTDEWPKWKKRIEMPREWTLKASLDK